METPAADTLLLADALRYNVRRLRDLRGLGVRALADRLREVGAPMTGSGVSKLEAGLRAVSATDWVALASALNVPMPALVSVPDVTDRHAWAPSEKQDEQRGWVVGITWIAIAAGVRIHRDEAATWLAGEDPGRSDLPWLAGAPAFEQFIAAGPPDQRRRHAIFRHPALIELGILRGAVEEVLAGEPVRGEGPIGVSRDDMAAYLRDHLDRLSRYVELLAVEVSERRIAGRYLGEGQQHGQEMV